MRQKLFGHESYYTAIGEADDDTEFSGRSAYEAFLISYAPVKSAPDRLLLRTHPRRHPIGWANVDRHALEVNSDLIAFAMLTFSYSTESVNGVPGKKVPGPTFRLPPPAGPEGTFVEDDGGLAHGARN